MLPMQIWKALSTAPHAYLFSIFGMFDRLDLYIALRFSILGSLTWWCSSCSVVRAHERCESWGRWPADRLRVR